MLPGREETSVSAGYLEIRNRRNSRVKITCYSSGGMKISFSAPGISLFCFYLRKVHYPFLLSRNFQNIFIQNLNCTFAYDVGPADHTQKHSSEWRPHKNKSGMY